MKNHFLRFFFQEATDDRVLSQVEIDKNRLLILMQWAIPLFLSWTVFDYYLDRPHFIFFLLLRILHVCFATGLFFSLKKQTNHKKIILIGLAHIFSVIACIGIMTFMTRNYLPYALGMSIAFIMPSIIMSWKPRYTIVPGLIAYFFILIPIAFLKKLDIPITDMVTGLFWDGTMLVASSVFSFIGYRYVMKVNDLTFNLQEKVKEKTLELNEKNQTLENTNLKLTELDKKKDDFLANTSHELRTPLNGIIGLAKFLIKSLHQLIPDERMQDLELIRQSGNRLNYLINDILDFSKLRQGDFELVLTEVNVRDTLSKLQPLLAPQMHDKNILFINDLTDQLPTILADENRIQQILYNLIGNAIKFTHQGQIRIYAETEGKTLKICVSDSGIGIAPNKLETIFNAFEQADGSISRSYGGTGLGLSVTKQLISLHQGKIGVVSTLGQGSTFYFTLPIVDETTRIELRQHNTANRLSESDTTDRATHALYSSTKIRRIASESIDLLTGFERLRLLNQSKILVVDDDSVNIVVTEHHLRSVGATVIAAYDGEKALELIHSESPDLVLLDIMMPGMSGYEVAEKIRSDISKSLPIVMLTALKEESGALYKGFMAGANDFLSKPYDETELFVRLESALHQQALIRAEQQVREDKILLLKTLAAGIAHELRTPLGMMMTHAQLGAHFSPNPSTEEYYEKVKTKFERIHQIGISAEQIISLILSNMRNQYIDAGQFSQFSALTLTNRAIEEYGFGYQFDETIRNKISVSQEHDFYFMGSDTLFVYIIFNLLKNSIYYLNSKPNNHIEIWLEENHSENKLCFKDYGPGINQEVLPHIFDSFMSAGKKDGTGLGLPFCQRTMHSFGGSIECQTEAGKYTLFILRFPKI